jgi:TPR repeat protein
VAKVPEQKPEPGSAGHSAPEKSVSEKNSSAKTPAEKSLIETIAVPPKTKKQFFEPTSEKISETKEPLTAHRLFPLPSARPPEPEKPAAVSSAFLKPPSETKKSAKPARAGASDSPSLPGTGDVQVFSATSALFSSSPSAAESRASPSTRPYVPPLEESFEQAWERANLPSAPDSPHLSRAAAGSIIAIALAVILGALAYNFRQDIGAIFIQLGQSISGENRPAAPTPAQETKPDTTTPDEQNRTATSRRAASQAPSTATESGNAANPPAGATGTSPAASATTPGASDAKPAPVAPPVVKAPAVVKPSENTMPGVSIDPAAKNGATADAESGQEEFGIARDILRGSNRQRDLSRAVELLWASVKKGHVPAEVTLADLYRRGDGVEKNCDQARVLLVAASKKGSLDAREMLQKVVTQGCE